MRHFFIGCLCIYPSFSLTMQLHSFFLSSLIFRSIIFFFFYKCLFLSLSLPPSNLPWIDSIFYKSHWKLGRPERRRFQIEIVRWFVDDGESAGNGSRQEHDRAYEIRKEHYWQHIHRWWRVRRRKSNGRMTMMLSLSPSPSLSSSKPLR